MMECAVIHVYTLFPIICMAVGICMYVCMYETIKLLLHV